MEIFLKKIFKITKLIMKVLLSAVLSGFLIFSVVVCTLIMFHTEFNIFLLFMIAFFISLVFYINWAIWTCGKIRKIIMLFFMTIFFLFMKLITMGPD